MNRLVGGYIRTSSERQAERVSPEEQLRAIQELVARNSDILVDLYQDTQKYRVGKRLVEPSGTRADRPQLKRMLADLKASRINLIVAWREDRLYRGYRPMIDVLEAIDEYKSDIELVKESFDKRLAPVKCWAAKMELDAKHDRMLMGVAGRYRQGKDWNSNPLYGLIRVDGLYSENPEEAKIVRLIWEWFGQGDTVQSIHERLIDMGAPQRSADGIPWMISRLRQMLKKSVYYTGILERKWAGERFALQVPIIVPPELAQPVLDRLARYKGSPTGRLKAMALGSGLVYCQSCGSRMGVVTTPSGKKVFHYYRCSSYLTNGARSPGCPKQVRMEYLDGLVWSKIQRLADNPQELEEAIEAEIAILKANQGNAEEELAKLSSKLEAMVTERQMVITWSRQKKITETDMDTQLAALSWQEAALRGEQARLKASIADDQINALRQVENNFRHMVEAADTLISTADQSDEHLATVFKFKSQIVQGIVKRISVTPDKTPLVSLSFGIVDHLTDSVLASMFIHE